MLAIRASRMTDCACEGWANSSNAPKRHIRHITRLPLVLATTGLKIRWDLPRMVIGPANHSDHPPPAMRGLLRTFTDDILARMVLVCAGFLRLGAKIAPTDE